MSETLDGVRGVLLDLDGTVYQAGEVIPGAAAAIDELRRGGLPLRFTTNTTRLPRRALVEMLRGYGIDVAVEEIFTAPLAAASWLRVTGIRRAAFLVAPETFEDLGGIERDEAQPEAVVVGDLGEGWTFRRLNRAFRQLMAGARLVAIQKGRYWLTEEGLTLDAGAFVAALEYASGRKATVVGKPSRAFFTAAGSSLGVDLSAVAVVGDDVTTDAAGAHSAGARGVLVRTGKFLQEELERSPVKPDLVLDSVADLPAALGL